MPTSREKTTNSSWLATAECENGTRVKVHEIDRKRGFIHGYLDNGIPMPQSWSIAGEITCSNLAASGYNLVAETLKEI